jgi:hypothetical protein
MKVESDTFIELGSDGTISNVVTQEAVEIGKKQNNPLISLMMQTSHSLRVKDSLQRILLEKMSLLSKEKQVYHTLELRYISYFLGFNIYLGFPIRSL